MEWTNWRPATQSELYWGTHFCPPAQEIQGLLQRASLCYDLIWPQNHRLHCFSVVSQHWLLKRGVGVRGRWSTKSTVAICCPSHLSFQSGHCGLPHSSPCTDWYLYFSFQFFFLSCCVLKCLDYTRVVWKIQCMYALHLLKREDRPRGWMLSKPLYILMLSKSTHNLWLFPSYFYQFLCLLRSHQVAGVCSDLNRATFLIPTFIPFAVLTDASVPRRILLIVDLYHLWSMKWDALS